MMKKHDFREMSDVHCTDCNAPLKLNLVEKNKKKQICYICGEILKPRNHPFPKKMQMLYERQKQNRVKYNYHGH